MRLSPSTLFTLIITFLSIYMLPTLLRTTAPRFTASITAAAKSRTPTILTTTTRLTSPVLAGASLFNLGNSASFFGGSASGSKMGGNNEDAPLPPKVVMSDSEWQAKLSPEQFRVLRKQGTERPGTGKYNKSKDEGIYTCGACDAPLYKSDSKFDSGCGWPAFFEAIPGAVGRNVDRSMFMERIEIVCNNCGSHLGHVFKGEGFGHPKDERHCVNSVSLDFKRDDEAKAAGGPGIEFGGF